jgi:4-diphosphocytidyl-2-C-methyl-D-erythritol kinase
MIGVLNIVNHLVLKKMIKSWQLKSYAKINLFLHITGKNKTGYHQLESAFSYIDLFDKIEISLSDQEKLIGNYNIPEGENIILKALAFFRAKYKITSNDKFHIKHDKQIPIGAGLGGGSSNAAAILKFLYDFYEVKESKEEKINLSKKLGADVPFFMNDHSRFIEGIGEIYGAKLNLEGLPLIIVKPHTSLLTENVFKNFNEKFEEPQNLKTLDWQTLQSTKNNLTQAATKLCPEIKEILSQNPDPKNIITRMTGSGSTCFYLFKNDKTYFKTRTEILKNLPPHKILETNLLSKIYNS